MSKLGENLLVAAIAGISAVVGALAGGFVTYESNKQLQTTQVHQEEARRTDSARAVARMLLSEYYSDGKRLEELIAEREYNPVVYRDHTFVSRLGLEDRKLLAGELSEGHWLDVAYAATAIEQVEGDFETHHGTGRIDSEEVETLQAARADCEQAFLALEPLVERKSSS